MVWSWRLVNIAIVLALIVVLLGGWTRLNDAGLGCPDWPTCYGHIVLPPQEKVAEQIGVNFPGHQVDLRKGWLEMIHRYAASTLGLLILLQAMLAWKQKAITGCPVQLSLLLLVLVIVQGIFGMWTVTLKLVPWVVTLHLLGGLTTLALLVRLRQSLSRNRNRQSRGERGRVDPSLVLLMTVLFVQIALGGWTSSNYAGWACDHWLSCQGDQRVEYDFREGLNPVLPLGPNYEGGLLPAPARAAIQMTHRAGALMLLSTLVLVSWRLRKVAAIAPWLSLCWGLMGLQVLLGVLNVIWQLPLALAVAHHAGAVALLLAVVGLYERSRVQQTEVIHGNLPTGQITS
ncbi:COX15/CtaA family protein [Marinobacterium sp. D7]|uniref:COX15/CtaA family protein n=1 Tax=Marinobacterium ramblicola TaxID=2849041 RepID=UPI001C2CF2E2|nr:COX15/CtaA family protein [Marinobacterium ramblicola]MBV1790762.1 COX15/CtaA family protein [Marinobacterium ramblicola]